MQDVEVGMVGVNVPIPVPMAFHSFVWKSILGDQLCMEWKEYVFIQELKPQLHGGQQGFAKTQNSKCQPLVR